MAEQAESWLLSVGAGGVRTALLVARYRQLGGGIMVDLSDWSAWGILGFAGAFGLCCVGTVTIAGGAAVAGGTVAATNAVTGAGGLGGALVSGLATALPLFVVGLLLRRRLRD